MFTQRSLVILFSKSIGAFWSKELVDFFTYYTQILCLTGATVKHIFRTKYIYTAFIHQALSGSLKITRVINTNYENQTCC
jgi:hypothetical protein